MVIRWWLVAPFGLFICVISFFFTIQYCWGLKLNHSKLSDDMMISISAWSLITSMISLWTHFGLKKNDPKKFLNSGNKLLSHEQGSCSIGILSRDSTAYILWPHTLSLMGSSLTVIMSSIHARANKGLQKLCQAIQCTVGIMKVSGYHSVTRNWTKKQEKQREKKSTIQAPFQSVCISLDEISIHSETKMLCTEVQVWEYTGLNPWLKSSHIIWTPNHMYLVCPWISPDDSASNCEAGSISEFTTPTRKLWPLPFSSELTYIIVL